MFSPTLPLVRSAALSALGIPHAVTTRHGGVSLAPFDTLNIGLHVPDEAVRVIENRRRICKALGYELEDWVSGEQVHGAEVAIVDTTHKGRGAVQHADSLPGIDGLVTNSPGLLLAGYFADCVPLLFGDVRGRAVGLAHAGWRGTLAGIAGNMTATLESAFECSPDALYVWVGPSIGPCCYLVDGDLLARFRSAFGDAVVKNGRYLDLWTANRIQLERAGVRPEHIEIAGSCTMCDTERYFSHRAQGPSTGRIAALIALPDATRRQEFLFRDQKLQR